MKKECIENPGAVYSTSETWTGKYWIDGKKVYQRTFTITNTIKNNWNSVSHNISNLDTVISCDGTINTNNSQGEQLVLGGYRGESFYSQMVVSSTVVAIFLSDISDFNGKTAYITVKYTKTTD